MNSRLPLQWLIIFVFLLTGCWDQRLLKDHSLILSGGYDKLTDGRIKHTVTYPITTGQKEAFPEKSIVVSVIGQTARDANVRMDKRIAEKFDASKSDIFIFGEELAKGGIYSALDTTYRTLRGPLNARVAVVKGEAFDALSLQPEDTPLITDYYSELLRSAEQGGISRNHNVRAVGSLILSEGKDFMVPYLKVMTEENRADVEGLAMFSDDKLTGKLGIKESTMYIILADQKKKNLSLTIKVNNDKKNHDKNYVNVDILKIKRKLEVNENKGEIAANIHLDVTLGITEYATDQLYEKKEIEKLNKKIQRELNKLATTTINKMQGANCDALGIGERVKAYHNQTWKVLDWEKVYPEIPIEIQFKSAIINHGITN
ncbi:Ger(x)C family spore germination protein [Lederbergia citrea]|uniref:Ger(x)C family spore germination protein n=1 Tax=Lederbergia citrea TaxID=2833581 RepID=UPI001BC90B88|nr:Ger(x)C family spore germination protein [Lederbergia citrea]MBS4178577.1 Ger(x)C family spore germination protein [Lederbergia citrea]